MNPLSTREKILVSTLVLVVIFTSGYGLYSYKRTIKNLKITNAGLREELTATEADFAARAHKHDEDIAALQSRSDILTEALAVEQKRGTSVEARIGAVSSSVGTLEKLSKTDPELLKQYSKVYFLNEHYVPISLTAMDPKYVYNQTHLMQIHSNVAPYLARLLDAASASGLSLKLDSAYRSFGTQAVLKSTYKVTYGAGTANSFSAEQGYSEHQLGTAVDFTAGSINGGLAGFDKTAEYQWLLANAYQYGFVISYPQNNGSYVFEPWHWRFVGVRLATDLHAKGMYFYAMDQREIDTYLANLFD